MNKGGFKEKIIPDRTNYAKTLMLEKDGLDD